SATSATSAVNRSPSAAKRIRERACSTRPPVIRPIAIPERRNRPRSCLPRLGNPTSRAQRLRAKELGAAGQRTSHQRERVDRRRGAREDSKRIGTVRIAAGQTPLAGGDQREREQR